MRNVVGWDIGGAHLKAVQLDAEDKVIHSIQLPCPLWKGLDFLKRAVIDAQAQLNQVVSPQALKTDPASASVLNTQHVITMTGELVDLFKNRHEGVCEIAKVATDLLGEQTLFYAATAGFVPLERVSVLSANIASTNWHASVSALAMHVSDALFLDIGSTTTDIIAIEGGKVVSEDLSDAHRMQTDSLVYTGVVRTPVMALAQKLVFEGVETNVAAEYFATMADVYRLTDELDASANMVETADGKGKTQLESARRLARMIGHDVDKSDTDQSLKKWIKLAFTCRSLHMQQIKTAMLKHLKPNMTIIAAGAGSFLVKQIADDLGHPFMPAYQPPMSKQMAMQPTSHAELTSKQAIEVCFPAYAVAYLYVKSVFAQKYKPC